MMSETLTPSFSDISAQDTALAAQEAQEWIEAVTGRTFSSSFRKSLEDGVILCELMMKLNPDSIRRINRAKSPIAHLDNIQQFLSACKELGLKDAQLFDKMDLQETIRGSKATGVKRNEADRRIRSGQTIAEMDDYSGPQLDLDAFKRIMYGNSTMNNINSNDVSIKKQEEQPNHFQLNTEQTLPQTERQIQWKELDNLNENGHGLTLEQEQSADELIADIQKSVDEMLQGFQMSPLVSPEPSSPAKVSNIQPERKVEQVVGGEKVGLTIAMNSISGGFGFRIVGGRDINAEMIPQVDLVAPGLAADKAGLKEGDQLVSVNKQDISTLNHEALVAMIKQAGAEGSVMLGVIRTVQQKGADPPKYNKDEVDSSHLDSQRAWEEQRREQERQALEIALMYPRGPPPTVGSRPLPPLVEHQEEAALEQINELLESTPIPPPQSSSPSPPPSPPTPTLSPPHSFSDEQATSQGIELQNDRESIERELQELALMVMAKPPEQSEEESSLASSSGKHSSSQQMATESPPVSAKQKTTAKVDDSDIEQITPPPPPPSSSEATASEVKKSIEILDDKDLETHLQELLEFNEMSNKDIMSLSPLESPPPPPPQAEAPKRQTVQQTEAKKSGSPPPATKPKPARKAPSPPKQKSTKKGTSDKRSGNEESILSQKTRLPAEIRPQSLGNVETDGSPETSRPTPSSMSEQKQREKKIEKVEAAQLVDVINVEPVKRDEPVKREEPVKQEEPVKSPTDRKLMFTPPPPPTTPPPTSPPASAETKSANEWNIVDTTKTTETPPTATPVVPSSSNSMDMTTPSNPTPTLATLYTTPLQSKHIKSEGSYHKEEMRSQTSEDVEIIGDMKISRVQRLKWTPKGSLVEFVTSPSTTPKSPFHDQIQQHYSYPTQDEEAMYQPRSSDTQKASKKAEAYQRYSQPPAERTPPIGREDRSNKSKSMYQISHNMQQLPPHMISPEKQQKTQWKSQEELRIHHNQQQFNHYPPAHSQQPGYHQQQQQQHRPQQHKQPQQQYSPGQHTQYNAGYRQNSIPNGHMGSYQSASLPRSKHEDWRVNRSNTWSAMDRSAKDGPQAAYAVKAGNPYELCSRCHQMLGGGPVMAIPGAKTQYHLQCFVCRMCRSPLVGTIPKNTLVIMKSRHPHCHRCVANNKDTVMTEC